MLDKTVPHAEIWMYRSRELPITEQVLPEGFYFEFYQKGDELEWATIEIAVLEFESEVKALDYFTKNYSPHLEELKKRLLFVTNSSGEKIGTCSAWWKETPNGTRYPLIHWVAVKPEYQGKGIANAMMSQTLKLLQNLEKSSPIYLHTQTWSHTAIRFYQKLGFEISNKNLDGSPNPDFKKAMAVLDDLEN